MAARRASPSQGDIDRTKLERGPMAGWARAVCGAILAAALLLLPAVASTSRAASPAPANCPSTIDVETYFDIRDRVLACFGDDDVTFTAFRADPEGLGGLSAYAVEPKWLDTWTVLGGQYYLLADDTQVAPGFYGGPYMTVAVPPNLEATFKKLDGKWVSVTGHFDDPAAQSCRVITFGH